VPDRERDASEGADEQTEVAQKSRGSGREPSKQRHRRTGSVSAQHELQATGHLVLLAADRITVRTRRPQQTLPQKRRPA